MFGFLLVVWLAVFFDCCCGLLSQTDYALSQSTAGKTLLTNNISTEYHLKMNYPFKSLVSKQCSYCFAVNVTSSVGGISLFFRPHSHGSCYMAKQETARLRNNKYNWLYKTNNKKFVVNVQGFLWTYMLF